MITPHLWIASVAAHPSPTPSACATRCNKTNTKPAFAADAEYIEGDGPTDFAHACKICLEGIVSKRKDSAYRCGRSRDWLKMKNPACAAVTREVEEDWAR